jgi:hypothetical protein
MTPVEVPVCTSTRVCQRTLFRVTRSVPTHNKISSSAIVITSIIRYLFYFYLFPCTSRTFLVVISSSAIVITSIIRCLFYFYLFRASTAACSHALCHFVSVFFSSLGVLSSWSQLCFSPIHAGTKAGASDQAHSFLVTRSTFSFGRRTTLKRSGPSWHSNVLTSSVVFQCIF